MERAIWQRWPSAEGCSHPDAVTQQKGARTCIPDLPFFLLSHHLPRRWRAKVSPEVVLIRSSRALGSVKNEGQWEDVQHRLLVTSAKPWRKPLCYNQKNPVTQSRHMIHSSPFPTLSSPHTSCRAYLQGRGKRGPVKLEFQMIDKFNWASYTLSGNSSSRPAKDPRSTTSIDMVGAGEKKEKERLLPCLALSGRVSSQVQGEP